MGRWGDKIYESDNALDYFSTITDLIERELPYFHLPKEVTNYSRWMARVISAVEMLLLLKQHKNYLIIAGYEDKQVLFWKKAILKVWDGNWNGTNQTIYSYVYDDPAYRQQHRPILLQIFEQLEDIALNRSTNSLPDTKSVNYQLPYFSVVHKHDDMWIVVVAEVVEHLVRDIIYRLSEEKRTESVTFNVEEVWVAVDILGFLCEKYEITPTMNAQVIHSWRVKTTMIWKQFLEQDEFTWDETDTLYQNVMSAFDHLASIAQKYPPIEW